MRLSIFGTFFGLKSSRVEASKRDTLVNDLTRRWFRNTAPNSRKSSRKSHFHFRKMPSATFWKEMIFLSWACSFSFVFSSVMMPPAWLRF